jgi:hypothetical protein
MSKLIRFKDRAEWLASRSQEPWPIGASDAAKIACGKSFEVWREKKLGATNEQPVADAGAMSGAGDSGSGAADSGVGD